MTYLETRTVSFKTPRDGRLEITERGAAVLRGVSELQVELNGQVGPASIGVFDCTCRSDDGDHAHPFVQSELLKKLRPETRVRLELAESGILRISSR